MDDVAEAILDAGLTPALQVTLLELHRRAEGGLYVGTQAEIAQARGVERGTVAKQMGTLADCGWLEKVGSAWRIVAEPEERDNDNDTHSTTCRDSKQDVDSVNTAEKGFPSPPFVFPQERISFNPLSPSHLSPSQREGESGDSPPWWQSVLGPIWMAEPLPDDHPARWEYHPGDWRWEAGRYVLRQLRDHDMLNTHYRRRLSDGERPGKIASEWADTFRLLHEQDGWNREEIGITMQWLFETENWWRQNRTVQSAGSLRKKGGDGTTKFDKILQSALSDYEQRKERRTTRKDIDQGWDEAIEEVEDELGDELAGAGGDAIPREPGVESAAL